jgi:hypothetical protein
MLDMIAGSTGVKTVTVDKHLQASSWKRYLAVIAARIAEGSVHPEFFNGLLARLFEISLTYVTPGLRLSEEKRNAVALGERPLVPPATSEAAVTAMIKRAGVEPVWQALVAS